MKVGTVKCCLPRVPAMTDDLLPCYSISLPVRNQQIDTSTREMSTSEHMQQSANKNTPPVYPRLYMHTYMHPILVSHVDPQFKYTLKGKCVSILGCLLWLSELLSGSPAGRVRSMREAYRVVRCTLRVTTCSRCPWSPHQRAQRAVPLDGKMSGLPSSVQSS